MQLTERTPVLVWKHLFESLTTLIPIGEHLSCNLRAGVAHMLFDVLLKNDFIAFGTVPKCRFNLGDLLSG